MPAPTYVPGTVVPRLETIHEGWALEATRGPVPSGIAGRSVPATVPGSAHTDLLAAGLIPDPYLGTNEAELVWAHRTDWRWTTTFPAAPAADGERVDLVLQGLDTVATVTLNGRVVAETANQHRSYRVDVGSALAAENTLTVDVRSALEYGEEQSRTHEQRPGGGSPHPYNMVRKMACSFGWDWGPDLQTAGIWKPIGLERWRTARLAQVRPLVTVDGSIGRWELGDDSPGGVLGGVDLRDAAAAKPGVLQGLGGPFQAPALQLGDGYHLAAFAEDKLDGPVGLDPRLGRRVLGHDTAPLVAAVEAIALDGQGGLAPGRFVAGLGQGFSDELGYGHQLAPQEEPGSPHGRGKEEDQVEENADKIVFRRLFGHRRMDPGKRFIYTILPKRWQSNGGCRRREKGLQTDLMARLLASCSERYDERRTDEASSEGKGRV